jgi:hypothetical protein
MINLSYLWNARPSVVDMVPLVQVGSYGYLTPVVGAKRATYLFVAYPVTSLMPQISLTPFVQPTFGGFGTLGQTQSGSGSSVPMIGQSWPTSTAGATSIGTSHLRYLTAMFGATGSV